MKKSAMSVLAVMTVVLSLGGVALAEEEPSLGFDVTLDFYSKYIWRGQLLNDDYAFQPGVSMTYDAFTLGIWGSVDMTDYSDNEWEFIEYDYYADYTTPLTEGVDLSLGAIYYYFPSGEATTEIYAGLGFDLPLSPSITLYNDIDEVDGSYVSVAIGHSIDEVMSLGDFPVGLEAGASLGWGSGSYNKAYWGSTVESSSLNDLSLSLALPVSMGSWTFTPSVNYVTLVDSKIEDTNAYSTDDDYFFTGLSFSTSF
ncbi:MAG: TorF family putative porin [Planctomycetota bacterium]